MGIFREEEVRARQDFIDGINPEREARVRQALQDLQKDKDNLIRAIVDSARRNYVKKGTMRAVADMLSTSSAHLVGNKEAQSLIAQWLHEFDPTLTATVKVGPDYSGKYVYAAEVVVEFTAISPAEAEERLKMVLLTSLAEVIEEVIGAGKRTVELGLSFENDLNIDSLSATEIVVHLEDRWGIEFSDDIFDKVLTVDEVVDYVMESIRSNSDACCAVLEQRKPELIPLIHAYAQQ